MKTIDDLIDWLERARFITTNCGVQAAEYSYAYGLVLEKANELKTNLEKGTKKASIPVTASFAKQCTAAVEIIESGNIFQKEMEKNNDSRKT